MINLSLWKLKGGFFMQSFFPVIRSHIDRDLNNIVDSFLDYNPFDSFTSVTRPSHASLSETPRANVKKLKNAYNIQLAAPGFSRDDFNVAIEDSMLTISATITSKKEADDYASREFNYSSFSRSWSLPDGAQPSQVNASYEAGILNVSIPVQQEETKKITVNID